ncbi:hypothetical protein FHL15_010489 [Xylaria flabelliformis]|uniref:Rhodopsin domain-containing protein n=1 Tax=Xylaria flabelliformis TaxID=2512241 RepID=A0A553HL08_9PEZI|nr:hypothetical protein FHL15_010489 [Xylaria flabelliformis]
MLPIITTQRAWISPARSSQGYSVRTKLKTMVRYGEETVRLTVDNILCISYDPDSAVVRLFVLRQLGEVKAPQRMKIPPVEVVSGWPKPNYIDPESRALAGEIVGSILLGLVTVILAIRLYSRKRLTNGFGLDDFFICFAYKAASMGPPLMGRRAKVPESKPRYLATSLTKLSTLAMVRRLTTASSNKIEGVVVLLLAVLITGNCFIFIIVEIFQCWPISSIWEVSDSPAYCINEDAHLMSANIINTVTDFIVVLLPIRTTIALELSPRHRVVVISLFGIGLVASAVGIARTYFTWLLLTAADHDTTWRAWYVWLSSILELHLGIICASVPATRPFFASHWASMQGFTKTRQKSLVVSDSRSNQNDEHGHKSGSSDTRVAL